MNEQISELKASLTEKDSLVTLEREKRMRAEQDVQRQIILLERTQRELSTVSSRASALRAEGRKARKEVLEAAECLRDVAGVLQATDSIVNGDPTLQLEFDIDNDPDMSTGMSMIMPHQDEDDPSVVGDSLGIQEIVSVVTTIKSFGAIIRRLPKNQAAVESTMRRLESENSRLQRELEGIEIVTDDRVQRLHSEIKHLEDQLRTLRKNAETDKDAVRAAAHLEHEVSLLRERCNKCDKKEKEMLLEIATLTTALERQNEGGYTSEQSRQYMSVTETTEVK